MKKMKLNKAILLCISLLSAMVFSFCSSCTREGIPLSSSEKKISVKLSFSEPARLKGGSALHPKYNDVNISVYNSLGDLVSHSYSDTLPTLKLSVVEGELYKFYAVVNAGEDISTLKESDMLSYRYTAVSLQGITGDFILSGEAGPMQLFDNQVVEITLMPCVAKVMLKGDLSKLNPGVNIYIDKVSLKNMPKSISLFGRSKISDITETFDNEGVTYEKENADIFRGGVEFNLLENMQGTLQPENTLQSEKVWPEGSSNALVCSYIELKARYSSQRKEGTLLYRFYLGRNMTSNYDVERNTSQVVTVSFTGDGSIDENSWRVDSSDLKDRLMIKFLEDNFEINLLANGLITNKLGLPLRDGIELSHQIKFSSPTEKLSFRSSAPDLVKVDSEGLITIDDPTSANGSYSITAILEGDKGEKIECVAPFRVIVREEVNVLLEVTFPALGFSAAPPDGKIPLRECKAYRWVLATPGGADDSWKLAGLKPIEPDFDVVLGPPNSSVTMPVELEKVFGEYGDGNTIKYYYYVSYKIDDGDK